MASNLLVTAFLLAITIVFKLRIFDPHIRGFYCDDETIAYPYKESTVSTSLLYLSAFLAPLAAILVTELYLNLRTSFLSIFLTYFGYLFGAAIVNTATDSFKLIAGRLRPHFLAVCVPVFTDTGANILENCHGSHTYITEYNCSGNFTEDTISQARVSFPSGHSSISFQAMVFIALYLQARLGTNRAFTRSVSNVNLLIPTVQLSVLFWAIYVAVSRVNDHKHHPTDVIAGALLGTVVQVFNVFCVMRLFRCRENEDGTKDERKSLKTSTYTVNNNNNFV